MPLPTPRWVMSSPSHMISEVPAVSVRTMTMIMPVPARGMMLVSNAAPERARVISVVDCSSASPTVT
jgi:hypothetical protein